MPMPWPFDPDATRRTAPGRPPADEVPPEHLYYVFDRPTVLAVNVALVTKRPLLVLGPPGSGKSSLAPNVARIMGRPYLEHVLTARSEATELFWTFDAVRRLADASAQQLKDDDAEYTAAGVLWRAFAPETIKDLARITPSDAMPVEGARPAVVLLDEIDKADPDLPDALLGPLGTGSFYYRSHHILSTPDRAPLVVITSNEERDLSRPFLRRCVVIRLPTPSEDHLVAVANLRYGPDDDGLHRRLAQLTIEIGETLRDRRSLVPSTAEFLDVIRACRDLGVAPGEDGWDVIERVALAKAVGAG